MESNISYKVGDVIQVTNIYGKYNTKHPYLGLAIVTQIRNNENETYKIVARHLTNRVLKYMPLKESECILANKTVQILFGE